MKAIILAAGSGSRLAPIGLTTPKLLVPILNKPILHHHVEAISPFVDEIFVIIGPNQFGKTIQEYIQNHQWPVPIKTIIQDEPKGTAHAYQAASSIINSDEQILCLNGDDVYSPQDLQRLCQYDYSVLGQPVPDPEKWGILQTNGNSQLTQLIEKPQQYIGNLAYTGAAKVSAEIFNIYAHIKASPRGEFEFTDTLTMFAKQFSTHVVIVTDYWLPIGYPWSIIQAHQQLLRQPVIGQNCSISSTAQIKGSTVIGNNVTIGDHAVVEDSTIFDDVNIDSHSQILHSVIGFNTSISTEVLVLSANQDNAPITSLVKGVRLNVNLDKFGTAIGDNVYIGSNSHISSGVKIWPNSQIPAHSHISQDWTEDSNQS